MTKQRSAKSSPSKAEKAHMPDLPDTDALAADASDVQPRPKQMGEGSYEATRDYQKNIGDYLRKANVDADAKAAKPRSDEEAREMQRAEEEGKSHSKAGSKTQPRN